MNPVVARIKELLAGPPMVEDETMDIPEEQPDEAYQYGVKRRSGRYPWGSGDNPYQRSADFLARYEEYKSQGLSDMDICKVMEISSGDLRTMKTHAKNERRKLEVEKVRSMKEDGLSNSEIARQLGYPNESSIRNLLNEDIEKRKHLGEETAKVLAEELKDKKFLDVGAGAALELGVTEQKLKEALLILEMDGYEVLGIQVPQPGNIKQKTTIKVLAPPGTEYKDIYAAADANEIKSITEYQSNDGGVTFNKKQYPESLDSKRIQVIYGDQGGKEKDGLIEIRPGCEDLNLGQSHFAQVRILVDGTHYLKGMAVYADDLPPGIDIRFNTNRTSNAPLMSPNKDDYQVLKPIKKDDPNNPFGAAIKANGQSTYIGKDGKEHLSLINKINEEGDWEKQHKRLSSQFLSKQPLKLINRQLDLTYADYNDQYQEIMSYTNPTIQRKMLLDMAGRCDKAAESLKVAALPRQRNQVLIPIPEMKDDEVFAPNFRNGEQVALIRHPHAGTFEIPILTVNNKNPYGKKIFDPKDGTVLDGVGINSKVAERLSGADFDGDSVTVIPVNENVRIKSTHPLKDLEGFDPKTEYAIPDGDTKTKRMTKKMTNRQMGIVSNLISDMTLKGATEDELARAVKHSMVVIDAEKHKLDYKRSERENGIAELKQKYQDGGGASTLISLAKSEARLPERQGSGHIDPETGEWIFKESGRKYRNKKGELVPAEYVTSKMYATKDAYTLSSGTKIENAYAEYANRMKALANQCRKSTFEVGKTQKDPEAAKKYKEQVDSLEAKLIFAKKNAPIERQVALAVNSKIKAIKQANPDIEKGELTKLRQMYAEEMRTALGARSRKTTAIDISDAEWEAIQNHAISDSKLMDILKYCDMTKVTQRAMPYETTKLSEARINKIKSMHRSGFTNQEIADAIGIPISTVYTYSKEGENNE